MALLSFVLKMTRLSAEQTSVFAGLITDVVSCVRSDSKEGSAGKDSGSCVGATEDVDVSAEVLAACISAGEKNVVAQLWTLVDMIMSNHHYLRYFHAIFNKLQFLE